MRSPASLALAATALLAACGSGTEPSTPPPPPPPPPPAAPVPASVAIHAGNNQEAGPGTTLAVRPVVLVKDALGRPFAGATVSFTIEAGGGSIDAPSATTAADGTASPGTWRLGPTEGENRLRARVGSLSPAVFTATSRIPPNLAADTTIGSGGGVITYLKSGDPLNGLRLTIPAGAYPGSGRWTIEILPPVASPNPRFRYGPRVSIRTDQGIAKQPLRLRIPVPNGSNATSAVFIEDPATGITDALAPISQNATTITVAAWAFSPSYYAGASLRGGASLRAGSAAHVTESPVTITAVTADQSDIASAETFTGFSPGLDDWEFPNYGSYLTPDGQGGGHAISEIFYYNSIRPVLGRLTRRFRIFAPAAASVWGANPQGYRVAALGELDEQWATIQRNVQALPPPVNTAVTTFDEMQLDLLAIMFFQDYGPQLMVATGTGLPPLPLVAYRVSPSGSGTARWLSVWVADPARPGLEVELKLFNRSLLPIQLSRMAGEPSATYTQFRLIPMKAVLNEPRLAGLFSDLRVGLAGRHQFPGYSLEYYDEDFGTWSAISNPLIVSWQPVQLRARCPSCVVRMNAAQQPADVTPLDVYDEAGNLLGTDRTTGVVSFNMPVTNPKAGVHVFGASLNQGAGPPWRHLDFVPLSIQASPYYITPNPAAPNAGAPFTLTVQSQVPATTPSQARYIWDFGNGKGATVDNTNTVQHTWTANGTYTVRVTVKDRPADKKVGSATLKVQVGGALPVWRLTQFQQIVQIIPKNPTGYWTGPAYSQDDGIFRTLQARPDKGLIIQQDQPITIGSKTFGRGVWLQFDLSCCATGLDPALEHRVLAQSSANPPVPDIVETFNGGAAAPYATGLINGRAANYRIPGSHTITHWEINASLSGTLMTGKIIRVQYLWEEDCKLVPDPIPGNPDRKKLECPPAGTPLTFFGEIRHEWSIRATRLR